jgi:hypothetical protein
MPNLHNLYKSAERKISQKNPEYGWACANWSYNIIHYYMYIVFYLFLLDFILLTY